MDLGNPMFRFHGAKEFAFLFDSAELLLVTWDRDEVKFLFRIHQQDESGLVLDYPGETFSNRVLDAVQTVFFIHVDEGTGEPAKPYVLGSYFHLNQSVYGAYYEREQRGSEVILFRLLGQGEETTLEAISGEEYKSVSAYFLEHLS